MKKYLVLVLALAILSVLLFAMGSLALAQTPAAQNGSDSAPSGPGEVVIPEALGAVVGPQQAGPGAAATVYFTPQDEDTSTTVIFLYNTGDTAATVGIQTFNLQGGRVISATVPVAARNLVRIAGDTVSTVSLSWENPVLINFTTLSTYARMTLPRAVKAEAYVVWNNGATYDPLQAAPTLPIRFSSDPATVLLPSLQR